MKASVCEGTAGLYARRSVNARGNGDAAVGAADRRLRSERAFLGVAEEHLAPFRGFAPAFEHAAVDERPAVEVVVHVAREDESVHERRVKEQFLEALERAEPN